jgi:transposase
MNFLAADREQPFLTPPDPRDWLPEDHLAWFVLAWVERMDLSAFYGSYRRDGWGRAAFEPSMMVSLLLYAYARGERSSRGIERKCVEDVVYRVIAAQQKPDYATIARFRARHEDALAELFTVLSLCKQAGLVKVGVIAIDGTKIHANASHHCNLDYEQLAKEILKEASEIDAAEDELDGDARGDELPEHLRTSEGRRAALAQATQKLEADRAENESTKTEEADELVAPAVKIELHPEVIVARKDGRDGWLREARRQLDEHRRREAKPIPRSRAERLLEAEQRLQLDLAVERLANEAYEHCRAHGRDAQGRRLSRPFARHPPSLARARPVVARAPALDTNAGATASPCDAPPERRRGRQALSRSQSRTSLVSLPPSTWRTVAAYARTGRRNGLPAGAARPEDCSSHRDAKRDGSLAEWKADGGGHAIALLRPLGYELRGDRRARVCGSSFLARACSDQKRTVTRSCLSPRSSASQGPR